MIRRDRDLKRLLQHLADQANARLVEVGHTNGGHRRAVFQGTGGTTVTVFAARSPSDHRSNKNMIAGARRRLLRA